MRGGRQVVRGGRQEVRGCRQEVRGGRQEVREGRQEVRGGRLACFGTVLGGRLSEVIWGYLHGTQNYAQILQMAQGEQQNQLCEFLDPADQVPGILVRPYQKYCPAWRDAVDAYAVLRDFWKFFCQCF